MKSDVTNKSSRLNPRTMLITALNSELRCLKPSISSELFSTWVWFPETSVRSLSSVCSIFISCWAIEGSRELGWAIDAREMGWESESISSAEVSEVSDFLDSVF